MSSNSAPTALRDGSITASLFTSEDRVQATELRSSRLASGSSPAVDIITQENSTAPPARPQPTFNKQIKRHTSQPILTWFQRKIAGNKHVARKRQAKELNNAISKARDDQSSHNNNSRSSRRPASLKIVIAPSPRTHPVDKVTNGGSSKPRSERSASGHSPSGSLRPGSAWSTCDLVDAADDDASIRPLPPTTPPSPVPSRSTHQSSETSGGYTSDLRTARSFGAPSTKPTTVMSIDLGPGGHIAQAPNTPTLGPGRGPLFVGPPTPTSSPSSSRFPHLRTSSTIPSLSTPLSFSILPTSESGSRSNIAAPNYINESASSTNGNGSLNVPKLAAQAPGHTSFHPRNNPRPASPPMDNASTLTLASSTFALSYASPRSRSVAADREGGDAAASVRALRPSSRRGSWGSDETGWSAAGQSAHTGVSSAGPSGLLGGFGSGSGIGMGHKRRGPGSVATAWSWKTGGTGPIDGYQDSAELGANDEDVYEDVEEEEGDVKEGDEEYEDEHASKVGGSGSKSIVSVVPRENVTPTEETLDLPSPIAEHFEPHQIPLPNSPAQPDHTPLPTAAAAV